MPDLDEQQFDAQLGASESISLAPLTEAELAEASRKGRTAELGTPRVVPMLAGATPDVATRMGARPGIPFDTVSGLPIMERLRMSFQPTSKEVLKELEKEYPGQVRTNDLGMPIVTMKDEQGRIKDVLADPIGIDWEDTSKLIASIPEIIAPVVALYATKGRTLAPGVWNALKTLALTAASSEGAGALKDIVVRGFEGEPIQLGEVAARRGAMSGLDVATGGIMGAGGFIAGRTISPFSHWGPLQARARLAQEAIAAQHGIKLGLTPAESTGSGILGAVEALESQKPGSKTAFRTFLENRYKQFHELQDIILGGAVPEEEAAGKEFLQTAGAKLAPAEFAVESAASRTGAEAEREIVSGVGSKVSKLQVGKAIRARAEKEREASETLTDALYQNVFSDPLTQSKNISMDDLATSAGAMLEKLPSTEKTKMVKSKLLNPQNQPISVPVVEREPIERFIEPGIVPKLEVLKELDGQQMRLDELMRMRRTVDQEIKIGEAVPGWKSHDLNNIKQLLTDKIKTGLEDVDPSGSLLSKWEIANTTYAKEASKRQKRGIAELYFDPRQPGYLTDEELVSRVSEGKKAQGIYGAYRDFFGTTSPEMAGIRQSIRDDVLGMSQLAETVPAKQFIDRLEALDRDAPEVLNEAFGVNLAKKLRSSAMAKLAAEGATLPKEELAAIARSGNLSAKNLTELMSAQAKRDELYRNDLFRQIAAGNVSPEKIRPTEVVDKLVFSKKTQPEQLRDLIALMADRPEKLEDLRRLTFKRMLDDATIVAPNGQRVIGANELEKALDDENLSKRLKSVLGYSTYQDLVNIKDFLKPGAVQQQAMKTAGGLAGGSQIQGMIEKGDLSYVGRALKNFLVATVYTGPKMRDYFANTVLSADDKAHFVNGFIASTPLIEAIMGTFTKEGARAVASELSKAESLAGERRAVQGVTPGTEDIPWDQFMQQLNR